VCGERDALRRQAAAVTVRVMDGMTEQVCKLKSHNCQQSCA
jgi:hypothetical protein